jgi:hypothetical protein
MGFTECDAWDGNNILSSNKVKGESRRTEENEYGLGKFKPNFFQKMKALKQAEKWPVFACAEVNAVYLLSVFRNVKLKDIRIKKAVDEHLLKSPCKNCSQWLEPVDEKTRLYKIKDEFTLTETEETKSKAPKILEKDFPTLSS